MVEKNKVPKIMTFGLIALLLCVSLILTASVTTKSTTEKETKTCGNCHQMQPQLYTWQESAHKQIPCTKCHPDSSLLSMFLRNRTDDRAVIKVEKFIKDDVCMDCHTANRTVTPPNSLIISHSLHMTKGVDCVDCHRDVAHAQVNVKVLEPGEKDFETFTKADAKKLASFGNRIPMNTCMKCHNGTKAPKDCSACHQNKPVPSSHTPIDWKTNHGALAFKDLSGCNFCHEYDVAKQQTAKVKNRDYASLQEYARTNNFCKDCHEEKPKGHNEVYSVAHNKEAKANKENCLVCHNWKDNNMPAPPSDIVCTKCHVSSTHPTNWVNIHKEKARGTDAQSCFSCHDQKSCTNCHSSRGVNLAK